MMTWSLLLVESLGSDPHTGYILAYLPFVLVVPAPAAVRFGY